jgi:hypothetical protein
MSSHNFQVLYPKLEYQPQFGCEKLSFKDKIKIWTKSFLRNCCDINLCRINTFTNKLISMTSYKHSEILTNDCRFNPNQVFNQMELLLQKLVCLEPSSYLISKQPNDNKLNIMKSVSNQMTNVFDLHFFYNVYKELDNEKPSCWLPLDTDLYLPYHHKLNRVPGLFEPFYGIYFQF